MWWSRRRTPDPDGITKARLDGSARRLVTSDVSKEDAVAELAALACGRVDLLAEVAGILLGAHQVDGTPWQAPQAAELLIAAGADTTAIDHWKQIGRERASRPMHSAPPPSRDH
ncbi:MAG: hypothetical protein GEV03_26785 [Streptosporangiales bacterium]|nr:hypothetical protein [Streptosporangiales bacterium]